MRLIKRAAFRRKRPQVKLFMDKVEGTSKPMNDEKVSLHRASDAPCSYLQPIPAEPATHAAVSVNFADSR
jgi:hypothetical protein